MPPQDPVNDGLFSTNDPNWTLKEVAQHSTEKDCFVVIRDKVYDVTDFVKNHPGGPVILTYAGLDATDVFAAFHPPSAARLLGNYCIGELATEDRNTQSAFVTEVRELRNKFRQAGLFQSSKRYYTFKVLFNIGLLILSVFLASFNTTPSVIAGAFLLGLFWQQSGWLSHDFLHHQVFQNREMNNFVGFIFGNWFQGFSVDWWKNKHNTHHAVPNVHGGDPDIDTLPFLAWSEHALEGFSDPQARQTVPKIIIDNQVFFYPVLLLFARLSWAFASAQWVYSHKSFHNRTQEVIGLAAHWLSLFGILYFVLTPGNALLYFVVSQASCGLLLASVFSLNHNGMPVITIDDAKKNDYYTLQIITGRDVEPTLFNSWFTGGLNYQIEHHIFPMIPRHNFHKIQPLVEALCKKHNIRYHKTSFMGGTTEVFQSLARVSGASKNL